MKLDKIKFAMLVSWISCRTGAQMDIDDINTIDNMLEVIASPQTIEELMKAIHEGKKIEAMKAYRTLIPSGLKEAKDAIEKDWEFKRSKQELYAKLSSMKLSTEIDNEIAKFINAAF